MEEKNDANNLLRGSILFSAIRAISVASDLREKSSQDAVHLKVNELEDILWSLVGELDYVDTNKSCRKVSPEVMKAEIAEMMSISAQVSKAVKIAKETTEEENGTSEVAAELDQMIQLLIERIQQKYDTDSDPSLIFGQGDLWSPLIQAHVSFNKGKSSITELEQTICLLATILETRLQYIEIAKEDKIKNAKKAIKNAKKAIREAEKELIGGDISSMSLGAFMDLLQPTDEKVVEEKEEEEEEEEVDDEAIARLKAVKLANRECNVKGGWADKVKLAPVLSTTLRSMTYILSLIRVLKMLPFSSIIKASTKPEHRQLANEVEAFLDKSELPSDWRKLELSVASILEICVMPHLLDGASTSIKAKLSARRVVMLIQKVLHYDDIRPYFVAAAAVPMNEIFGEYTVKDELPAITSYTRSHFLGGSDGGICRRTQAARSFCSPIVYSFLYPDCSPETAYGVCCLPTSAFWTPTYNFLHSEKKQITQTALDKLADAWVNYSKASQNDFILLDLAVDLENGNTQSLDRLKKFFQICAV